MCGIFGTVNINIPLSAVKNDLIHRGPDEQSTWRNNNIQFHHFRLSILDLIGGAQPMQRGQNIIVFNGQIYNHKDLRVKYNLNCETNSDTETLLALYELLGESCLDELDGMFAFAIYSKDNDQIFLARDRAGKKPLYIYEKNDTIIFSSELNALKSIVPLDIEENSIANYVRLGSMFKSQTPYKFVSELLGGQSAVIDVKTMTVTKNTWWQIEDQYISSSDHTFEEASSQVEKYLIKGVHRRIDSSDLEVGSFLSGGIDSGLVTAIAAEHISNLRTFTVSFNGQYNEAPLAKLVSDKYDTNHTEIEISFDNLLNDIEDILGNYGEPFADSSAIPSYYVSKAAKKEITVVLNGDGADELFGGYRRYIPYGFTDITKMPNMFKQGFRLFNKCLPIPKEKKSFYNYLFRLFEFGSKDGIDSYLSTTVDILEGFQQYIKLPSFNKKSEIEYFDNILRSNKTGLQKIMNLDFNILLFSDLLVKMDIATMSHSLEGRSPFLCKELLEYAPSMNDKYKVKGTKTKALLRHMAKKYLPNELVNQPKRGFEIPLKSWVNMDLKDIIFDTVHSNSYSCNYIEGSFIKSLKENKINISSEKRAKILWTLFSLEMWHKRNYN